MFCFAMVNIQIFSQNYIFVEYWLKIDVSILQNTDTLLRSSLILVIAASGSDLLYWSELNRDIYFCQKG